MRSEREKRLTIMRGVKVGYKGAAALVFTISEITAISFLFRVIMWSRLSI